MQKRAIFAVCTNIYPYSKVRTYKILIWRRSAVRTKLPSNYQMDIYSATRLVGLFCAKKLTFVRLVPPTTEFLFFSDHQTIF